MWDASLYAVSVFYYHWLIKKLIWPIARQDIDGGKSNQRYREKTSRVRETPAATRKERCEVIPLPHGNT